MIVVCDTSPITALLSIGKAGTHLADDIKETALRSVGE